MALILNIETATETCSASLAENGKLIALKENIEGQQHARLLTVFIEELFKETGRSIKELDAVAVSKGPGSYTGLRIGVSAAKGIAYSAGIPLIALSTLQALCSGVLSNPIIDYEPETWLCPMIDARRMEVYTALYDISNQIKREISAEIIDENSFQDILQTRKVLFFGNGALKCQEKIQSPNAVFIDKVICSALDMIRLSFEAFQKKDFVDVAYFEPLYLKDFVAILPKNLLHSNQAKS